MNGGEPVYKKGAANFAILLLHGFKATPFEMKEYGLYLHEKFNATVSIPILPNHGVDYKTLNKSKWEQWHQFVSEQYKELSKNFNKVFIIGMSMGGALALRIASEEKPSGIICVGTPYKLPFKTKFAFILSYFKKHLKDTSGADIKNEKQKALAVTLSDIPLLGLIQLIKMLKDSEKLYKKVESPILLCHSLMDHVIPYKNMELLKNVLKSNPLKEHTYKNSYHIIPLDNDRYELFEDSSNFINNLI